MNSIKTKQTILIVVSVFLTAILIGTLGIITTDAVLEENSSRELSLICENERGRMNDVFSRVELSVDSMADYATGHLDSYGHLQQDAEYMQAYTADIEQMAEILAFNTEGAVAFYFRYNPEVFGSTDGFFWSWEENSDEMVRFPATDLAQYDKDDIEHVGWYYIPVEKGEPTWMEPYYNRNDGIYMISYVVPVYKEGRLLGVAGMDIDFELIVDRIDEVEVFDEGYAYLLDDDGTVIYHPDYQIGEEVDEAADDVVDMRVELDNGMVLGILAPNSDINASRNRLVIQVVGLAILIAAICSIISVIMSGHLIRPLLELNEAAKKIADGDLNVTLSQNTSKDEIGVLTENFRRTVEHLKEYVTYIKGIAYKDSLTGVQNTASYRQRVEELSSRLEEESFSYAIVIVDVNGLKATNDTLGHEAGNQVIVEAAKYTVRTFSPSLVYRIGGDEFAVILTGFEYENRDKLLEEFEQKQKELFFCYDGRKTPISLAIGMAEYDASVDGKYLDVFARADEMMYRDKEQTKRRLNIPLR